MASDRLSQVAKPPIRRTTCMASPRLLSRAGRWTGIRCAAAGRLPHRWSAEPVRAGPARIARGEVRIGRTRFRPIGQTGVLACAYQAGRGLPVASLRSQLLLDRGEIDRSALPADQAVAKCRRRARSGSGRVGPARPDRMGAPSRWRVGPTHRRRGRRRTDGGRVRTGRSASRRTGPGRTPRSAPHRAGSGRGARRRRARHRAGSPQRSRPDRRSFFAR
jgi:hypothetical protein